jgi:hypothetical protein
VPTLYNTETQQTESLSEDQLESAILNGTHNFLPGDSINVINPAGDAVAIPTDNIKKALESGYKIETAYQGAINDYVDENAGLKGAAKVALGQIADEALFGIPETIYDEKADPLDVARKEALKKEHEAANTIGAITGFAGSLATGAPLFKGAAKVSEAASRATARQLAKLGVREGAESIAKDIAAKAATGAAKLGTEGIIVSAPMAITEAALGDMEAAGEALLLGGGLGAGLGASSGFISLTGKAGKGVASLARKGTGKAVAKAEKKTLPQWLKSKQVEATLKSVGFQKSQFKKINKEGKLSLDELADFLIEEKIVTTFASGDDIIARFEGLVDETGKAIGKIYKDLDEAAVATFNPQAVADVVEGQLGAYYNEAINKGAVKKHFDKALETIRNRGDQPISFEHAKELIGIFQQEAFERSSSLSRSPKAEMSRKIYGILRKEINNAVDAAGQLTGNPGLKNDIVSANKKFQKLMSIGQGIENKQAQVGNNFISITDYMMIGTGGIGSTSIAGGVAGFAANQLKRKLGAQFVSGTLAQVEQALKTGGMHLDARIPEVFTNISSKAAAGAKKGAKKAPLQSIRALSRLLSSEDTALTRVEAFAELSERLSELNSNPDRLAIIAGEQTEGFEEVAPEMTQAYQMKLLNGVQYLYQSMPKSKAGANPFKKQKYQPSDLELAKFERKAQIVLDPFSALSELEKGTLTRDHVEALKTVYPKMYEILVSRITQYAAENESEIPYAARNRLSLLLGVPLDESVNPGSVQNLQKTYQKEKETQQPQGKAVKTTVKNIAEPAQTEVQRLQK